MSKRHEILSPAQAQLRKRAREEMDRWFSTLSYKIDRSPWGRDGGNTVTVGLRHGKTARRNKKLKASVKPALVQRGRPTKCGAAFGLRPIQTRRRAD